MEPIHIIISQYLAGLIMLFIAITSFGLYFGFLVRHPKEHYDVDDFVDDTKVLLGLDIDSEKSNRKK